MESKKRIMWILGCLILQTFGYLDAQNIGYFVWTNGYRQDKVETNIQEPGKAFDTINDVLAKEISLYQIGLKGKWVWCNWLIRLEGDCGWSNQGKLHDYRQKSLDITEIKAQLHHVNCQDFLGNIGYYFNLYDCFLFGPTAGWSFQNLKFQTHDHETIHRHKRSFGKFHYENRWQGPYLGVDAFFNNCLFSVDAGYEYHWAVWNAAIGLEKGIPNRRHRIKEFSERCKSKNAHGHVFTVNARWNFCWGWYMGIGAKVQEWRVSEGSSELNKEFSRFSAAVTPNGPSESGVISSGKVKRSNWCSYAITYDLGYVF